MCVRLVLGTAAAVFVLLGSHGQHPGEKPPPAGGDQSAALTNTIPKELEALNRAARELYAGGRARELAKIPAVILVSGDDLGRGAFVRGG
jgi:hypothetical protein